MRDRYYSTADLARVCGVSISTIKRWTDSGLLRCVRTPGGHRKFRVQDVAEAARRLSTSMAAAESPGEPAARLDELALLLLQNDREALLPRIAAHLERGEGQELRRLLVDLHRHGMGATALADVLQAAVGSVHADPGGGPAADFVRRRALRLAEDGARHLQEQLPPPLPESPAALLCAGPGVRDGLWTALCAWVLRELGWNVVDLGTDVPSTTVQHGLARLHPALVAIVGPMPERDLRMLRAETEAQGAALVVLSADTEHPLPGLAEQARTHERRLAASCV